MSEPTTPPQLRNPSTSVSTHEILFTQGNTTQDPPLAENTTNSPTNERRLYEILAPTESTQTTEEIDNQTNNNMDIFNDIQQEPGNLSRGSDT
jgi:hypothetical protein